MPELIGNVLSWGSDVEKNTIEQAAKASRLPFVNGHLALMPDAHVGMGATVGSVIPTTGAIIPAAIGVDIGCGMIASETDLDASDLPDDMGAFLGHVDRAVPAGVGRGHNSGSREQHDARAASVPEYTGASTLSRKQIAKVADQFGTLGSGNHFVEVCLDERDRVWVVLHSGSRGIGNQLASQHIEGAKGLIHGGRMDGEVLNKVEMAFRAYDPCHGCATHSLPGNMPLAVRVHDSHGNVQATLRRDWDGVIRRGLGCKP